MVLVIGITRRINRRSERPRLKFILDSYCRVRCNLFAGYATTERSRSWITRRDGVAERREQVVSISQPVRRVSYLDEQDPRGSVGVFPKYRFESIDTNAPPSRSSPFCAVPQFAEFLRFRSIRKEGRPPRRRVTRKLPSENRWQGHPFSDQLPPPPRSTLKPNKAYRSTERADSETTRS